jgi:hypothetical protein
VGQSIDKRPARRVTWLVRRFFPSAIAVLVLLGCTPGPQDPKPAPDQSKQSGEREQAVEGAPGSRGAATGTPAPAPAKQAELTERTFDARFDFALSYPSTWTATEGPGVPALFVTSPRESPTDAFVENVNVVVEELAAPMSVEAYADGSALLMETDLVDYREISRTNVDLGGQPAVRREYQHNFAGRDLWVVSYMMVVENQAYVLTATAEREHAEAWRRTLEAICQTFRQTSE